MGLEKIISKILADSKAKEQSIISGAQKESKVLIADAKNKKAEILDSYQKKADEMISQMRIREEAGMEIDVNKKMLSIQREILDTSFDSLLEHFKNLPDDRKKTLYSAMIEKMRQEITTGTIHCRKGEERLFSGLSGYTMGQPIDTIGGFLVENSDGSLFFDMRFEALLRDIWVRNLKEISEILFPRGDSQ